MVTTVVVTTVVVTTVVVTTVVVTTVVVTTVVVTTVVVTTVVVTTITKMADQSWTINIINKILKIFDNNIKMSSNVFITGTTTGIGQSLVDSMRMSDACNSGELPNLMILGNRNIQQASQLHPDAVHVEFNAANNSSIDQAIVEMKQLLEGTQLDIIYLNHGTKATTLTTLWFNQDVNRCRVVNALSYQYTLEQLHQYNLVSRNATIVLTGSMMHWCADIDPTNALPNQEYANSKLALMFIAKHYSRSHPLQTYIVANPGMVDTKIFGKPQWYSRLQKSMSTTPTAAGAYMHGKSIIPLEPGFHYCSPYRDLPLVRYVANKYGVVYRLHDVFGKWLAQQDRTVDSQHSPLVNDATVKQNYLQYLGL